MAKVALIFGATGIVGSALAEELASTSPQEWKKIIITSRREPQLETKDNRVHFVSIDLEKEDEKGIKKLLVGAGAEETTHMFFTAYIHSKTWDGEELCRRNTPIFEKSIKVVDSIAPNLQRIVLQLGMKYYGVHLRPAKVYPVSESNTPRHEPVPGNPNFYYAQEDALKALQKGKKWTYTTTSPNHILGVTRGNGMSAAPSLVLYFLIRKELGLKATFPGSATCYKGISDTSNAELIAQFSIMASTHPKAENEFFNIIDHNTVHQTWEQEWAAIGKYLGVEVEGPKEKFSVEEYMKDKKEVWETYAKKHGADPKLWDYATFDFVDAITHFEWANGPYDLSKAQSIGWNKEIPSSESFIRVFDKLKKLKFI